MNVSEPASDSALDWIVHKIIVLLFPESLHRDPGSIHDSYV